MLVLMVVKINRLGATLKSLPLAKLTKFGFKRRTNEGDGGAKTTTLLIESHSGLT